jgi:hypothetical protein
VEVIVTVDSPKPSPLDVVVRPGSDQNQWIVAFGNSPNRTECGFPSRAMAVTAAIELAQHYDVVVWIDAENLPLRPILNRCPVRCPRCGETGIHATDDECLAALRLAIERRRRIAAVDDHRISLEPPTIDGRTLGARCSWCGATMRQPRGMPADDPLSWSHDMCGACRAELCSVPRRPSNGDARNTV